MTSVWVKGAWKFVRRRRAQTAERNGVHVQLFEDAFNQMTHVNVVSYGFK